MTGSVWYHVWSKRRIDGNLMNRKIKQLQVKLPIRGNCRLISRPQQTIQSLLEMMEKHR